MIRDGAGRLARLVNMIFYIQARPGVSIDALAERYGISRRQVFRDIDELEDAGVPIYYDCGYRILNEWEHIFYRKEGRHELSDKVDLRCGNEASGS